MNYKLPTILKSVTLIVALVLFGLTQARGQSDFMSPYEVDDNTVILMDFDDATDSMRVQHGQNIDAPDTAIAYAESGGVTVPDSSISGFGNSLHLSNPQSDEDNSIFDFVAIPYFEGYDYPAGHETGMPDTAGAEQYTDLLLAEDFTIEFWARPETINNNPMQMIGKPGSDAAGASNNFQEMNYHAALYPTGEFGGGWYPAVEAGFGTPGAVGKTDSTYGKVEAGKWYHFKYVKDFDNRVAVAMVHDAQGNLVNSAAQTFSEDVAVSDTSKRNDIFIGWNPAWNIAGGNYPSTWSNSDVLGDAPTLGGLGRHLFNGNIDELRISNIARQYTNVNIPYLADGTELDPQSVEKTEYEVSVDAGVYGSNTVQTVNVVYNTGEGEQSVQLADDGSGTYSGAIPQQDAGTTVNYYYEITDSGGNTKTMPANASEGNYYTFTVFVPNQEVLKLSFEETYPQIPVDSSSVAANQDVVVNGDTAYSQNAMEGFGSFDFTGSNQIAVENSPFTVTDIVTTDLWFYATSMPDSATRLIAKEGANTWDQVNYEVRFGANGTLVGNATGIGSMSLDTGIETEKWYRVVYMIGSDAASLQLRNVRNEVIDSQVMSISSAPQLAEGPLVIGHAGGSGEPYFQGYMDRVRVSNYPDVEGPFEIQGITDYYQVTDAMEEYPFEIDIVHAGAGNVSARLHYLATFAGTEGWAFNNLEYSDGEYTTSITAQPAGKMVPHYVTASTGPFSDRLPDTTGMDTTFTFGVAKEYSQTLDLGFEGYNSEGVPQDSSMYSEHNVVELKGQQGLPTQSDDAPQGNTSMAFSAQDSSYIEINSPFLSSGEFTVDFWLKATDLTDNSGVRVIARQGGYGETGAWWQPNYQGFLKDEGQDSTRLQMATNRVNGGLNGGDLQPNPKIAMDEWFRVTYEFASDSVYYKVRDTEGNVVGEVGYAQEGDTASITRGPLTIGHADGIDHQYFTGMVDNVEIYNYPVTMKPPMFSDVQNLRAAIEGEGPYTISATIERDVAEAMLHYSTDGGENWSAVEMTSEEGSNVYSGGIPDMTAGDMVHYFIEAKNSYGTTSYSPTNAMADSNYYAMTIGAAQDKILHLSFEEGEGTPVDSSSYNHEIMMQGMAGTPSFTEDTHSDSVGGSYAMEFAQGDSSFIAVDSPLLAMQQFTIDVWFKPYDNFDDYSGSPRIIAREGGHGVTGAYWQPNYQIFMRGNGDGTFGMRGANYYFDSEGNGGLNGGALYPDGGNIGVVDANKWYRAVYRVGEDSTYFSFRDSANVVIGEVTIAKQGTPALTNGPFTIGHFGPDDNDYFMGIVDEVRVFNYGKEIPAATSVAIGDQMSELPKEVELKQNYPNPFNPSTRIRFALPQKQEVTLKVYDMLAREVATLVSGTKDAGRYNVNFDASHLSSGVYFYRLTTEETTKVKKMMLIK